MAESRAIPDANLRSTLFRWRWLLGFLIVAWVLAAKIPTTLTVAPSESLLEDMQAWALSPGIRLDKGPSSSAAEGNPRLQRWQAQSSGNHWASRALVVPAQAEFLRVAFCVVEDVAPEEAAVLLASVRDGELDFNRQYRANSFYSAVADECFEDAIPRRKGDGPAILQVQLLSAPAALSLRSLDVTPLRENPTWRLMRMGMLFGGLVLLVLVLGDYRHARPRLLSLAGLMTVLAIVFGCCVSVSLKAEIFEILTGGRSIDAKVSMGALLTVPFPLGGFSLFTFLHGVLFCGATILLGLTRRYAWVDILLLAPITETLQLFVPGRGPGISDMLVDWYGVGVAVALVFLLRRSQRVRSLLQN